MVSRIKGILGSVRIDELPRRRTCRVPPTATLGEVYARLRDERSVAVLVEEDGRLVGIFTERDVLNRTVLEGQRDRPIAEFMTRDVITLAADEALADAVTAMTERRIRHIPLVDAQGRASGMIGGRDLLKMIAEYYPETLLNLPPHLDQRLTKLDGG